MNNKLEEFLERFVGVKKIVIFNRKENIEDTFEENEIPEEWLEEYVEKFSFGSGILCITI